MGTRGETAAQDNTEAQGGTRQRNNATRFVLLALLAVAVLATGGIFVRQSGLSPINTGFYRMLFSIPLLWPLAYGRLHRLTRSQVALLFVAGLFLAGDVALWNTSFGYTTVANANLLTNLTPFTVIPVSYFLFHERLPRLFLPGAAVTLAGVLLLVGGMLTFTYFASLLVFRMIEFSCNRRDSLRINRMLARTQAAKGESR